MVNFDPEKLTARVDALEAEIVSLKKRLNISDGNTTEAGVGAAQLTDTVIPAKELGAYTAPPHSVNGDERAAIEKLSGDEMARGSVMDRFLESRKG